MISGGRVLFLEVKSQTRARLRKSQEVFRDTVVMQGFGWALVRSVDDALGALAENGFTSRVQRPCGGSRHEPQGHPLGHRTTRSEPTTKIVLWHLCDRFNPDFGCFPSQARLAEDCEISRSTLNDHLGRLEAAKLLRRVPRVDPVTKRQMPTRYILGFEDGGTPHDPEPCPESGHGDWLGIRW